MKNSLVCALAVGLAGTLLAGPFDDCTGLANVSKGTLLCNGAPAPNYSAKATAEGIVLMANGTMLIMR